MKYLCSLITYMLLTLCCYAQINSVLLMDRVGNIISTHSTIQSAYNAIPTTLTQPYIIKLQSTYISTLETYPVKFVEKAGASKVNTITITGTGSASGGVDTADMFQFDGADWISFDGKIYLNANGTPNNNVFHFKNGACYNTIKGVYFSLRGSPHNIVAKGHHVYIGATTQAGGNSHNTIESCEFRSSYSAIVCMGNVNYPNADIRVLDNYFSGWGQCIRFSGSDTISVSANTISYVALKKQTRGIIDISEAGGQILIDGNDILIRGDSGAIAGLYVKPTRTHDVLISNNIIQNFGLVYANDFHSALDTFADMANNITGLWMEGSGATGKNEIYHNTISIWGKSAQTIIDMQSYCLRLSGTHNADIDIKNNIFLNYRKAGKNARHNVFDFGSLPSVLKLDYNRYCSYGGMASGSLGNSWNSWVGYRSALSALNGSETNSDSADVWFAGGYGKGGALHARMYSDSRMYGTPLPKISKDIIGTTRAVYYKGVNEYVLSCSGILEGGEVYAYTDSCGGHYSEFTFNGKTPPLNGVTYQWQSRPFGSSQPFADILGEDIAKYIPKNSEAMDYRVQVGCIGSGKAVYSDTVSLFIKPLPSVDSIKIEKKQGWDYTFTGMGAQLTTHYIWNLEGVNSVTTDSSITYNFKAPGTHTIRLIVSNNGCGRDTVYTTIDVGLGIEDPNISNTIKVYPNPATDRLIADVAENTVYTATDISGRVVLKGNINKSGIDISGLSKGLYLLGFVMPDDTRAYTRFVKE